ncbi:MAG: hypothetical protein ACRYFR_14100 [Janthinobacterium lividum]
MPRAPSTRITAKPLVEELARRKLSKAISDEYLEQHTTAKGNKVLAFKNDLGGFTWYLPARNGQPEQWAKKGQPAPRTLRASPKAEGIRVKVFSQFFDMLTYVQVMGKADDETLIVEPDLAYIESLKWRWPKSITYYANGQYDEQAFILPAEEFGLMVGVSPIESLSEAYMDNPHRVSHAMQPQGIRHDLKQAQSQLLIAARLRPGA